MPPTPTARAVADRFIFDTGNLKYLASAVPDGALDRVVQGGDWTVRQVLAHLANSFGGYADILQSVRLGQELDPSRFDPTRHNAEVARANKSTRLPAIVERFNEKLRRLVDEMVLIDEASSRAMIGLLDVPAVLRAWSNHASTHGLEMLETLPELRDDAMMLNWLLYEDFSESPKHRESQLRLLREVQARYGSTGEEDDHDPGS